MGPRLCKNHCFKWRSNTIETEIFHLHRKRSWHLAKVEATQEDDTIGRSLFILFVYFFHILSILFCDFTSFYFILVFQNLISRNFLQLRNFFVSTYLWYFNSQIVKFESIFHFSGKVDSMIQETIRHQFKNCSVLTVAHWLNTLMDSDRILVMNDSEVVEFDTPARLLENEEGFLTQLVNQTGSTMKKNWFKWLKNENFDKGNTNILCFVIIFSFLCDFTNFCVLF